MPADLRSAIRARSLRLPALVQKIALLAIWRRKEVLLCARVVTYAKEGSYVWAADCDGI